MTPPHAAGAAALCALVALAVGCARDVRVRYPSDGDLPTGSVTVLLTRPARDLTVAINGIVVAKRAHTREVRITEVPAGSTSIIIAAGGGGSRIEKHFEMWVEPGENVAIPLGAPEQSMSSSLQMGMLGIGAWVLSRAIYLAFL